jgi:hypothetical protein
MTNTPHTYWVSIGRNVGTVPMGHHEWQGFQDAIAAVIDHLPQAGIITEVDGSSTWDATPEETHLFLVTVPAQYVNLFRARLALLVPIYRQDAIGFVGGPSTDTLIRP